MSRLWHRLKLVYLFLLPIRFSMLAVALAGFAFLVSDQGQDMTARLCDIDPQTGHAHRLDVLLFLVLLNLLAYSIWYWARQMLRLEPAPHDNDAYYGRRPDPESEPWLRDLALWLPRLLSVVFFILMFAAFVRVRQSYGATVRTVNASILIWIAVSLVVFVFVVIIRRKYLEKRARGTIGHCRQLPDIARQILRVMLVFALAWLVWTMITPTSLMAIGAGSILLLTLSLWVPFGSVIVYGGMRARLPILTLLLVEAFLISPIADHNHVIRAIDNSKAAVDARPLADTQLAAWYKRVAPHGERVPAFVVATEGGGIRAAYWTASVLDSLQDTVPNFGSRLFAVSGVSGGSLGTIVYTALRSDGGSGYHARGARVLQNNFLSPTLAVMSQGDMFQRFLPLGFRDRESALETAWEAGYGGRTFGGGVAQLFAQHPDLPSVFINGTMVETGDRIITSNCRIRPRNGDTGDHSSLIVFRNAFDGLDILGTDLPLSATAGMSARFTYVSPAGRLPRAQSRGHVVDGGYFENSGAVTASEVVEMIERSKLNIQPVIILIDYDDCPKCPNTYGPFPFRTMQPPPLPAHANRFANEVFSPLAALLQTRGAHGTQAVGDVRVNAPIAPVVEFRVVQREIPLPLGWVLSAQARDVMDGAVESELGNVYARAQIAGYLGTTPLSDAFAKEAQARLPAVHSSR